MGQGLDATGEPLGESFRCGGGIARQVVHQLSGWYGQGQLMGLAGPEVDLLGVTVGAGVGSQRGGEVVQLGVGDRRGRGVVSLEGVDQSAGEAAGEGAGQAGVSWLGDGVAMGGAGACLGAAEEGGAERRR